MINRLFYKEFSFWCGIILIILDNTVLSNLFTGQFFTATFWTTSSKVEQIVFLVLGILLIIKSLFYVTSKPRQRR